MWPRAVLTVALRGPGKVLVLASAAGWIALAWLLSGDPMPHAAVAMTHGGHASATAASMSQSPVHFTAMWLAMILAMAPPLLLREIGRLWRSSLHRRRPLTLSAFLSGYVAVWLLVGVALAILAAWVSASTHRVAAAVVLIALWHCSPARQRCLNACHRTPRLRVFGMTAQWDALRYGLTTGGNCAAACGLAMLLVLLAGDAHLTAMAVVTVVATVERHLPAQRPRWRWPAGRGQSLDWPQRPVATSIL